MVIKGYSLKFLTNGGITYNAYRPDHPLHRLHMLAIEFADTYLSEKINFADYDDVTVSCEVDDDGAPVRVVAMACRQPRYDYPVLRFINQEAGSVLMERMRASLDDRGLSGSEVFVHISKVEPSESRCPKWKDFLKQFKAEKASRWRVRV